MVQSNEFYTLSFIDTLTRNLLLFSIMLIALGLGLAVYLLDKHSLDFYVMSIRSERLSLVFFIIVVACYITLLFIYIKSYWVNFIVQLLVACVLVMGLMIACRPIIKIGMYFY